MSLSKEIERRTILAQKLGKKDGAKVSYEDLADWYEKADFLDGSFEQVRDELEDSQRKFALVEEDRRRLKADLARNSNELMQLKNELSLTKRELKSEIRESY